MVDFEETIAIYNDLGATNMNLISQIKKNTQGASMMILCMIGFGLNLLCTVRNTTNSMTEFQPQKECRKQELMEYLVHTERCPDIILMKPEAFLQLCQQIREIVLVKEHINQPLKNKLPNFSTLLGIM